MIDFIKAKTENQTYINRLFSYAQTYLKPHRPQNNNYVCFSNGSGRFRFEFRKIIYKGKLAGFYNVEICFSPHYHFNNDLHNGNDFAPVDATKTIKETFLNIGIAENEMEDFRVVNLEYGLNLVSGLSIENLINGILYTKKTYFEVRKYPYNKISKSTKYKEIKVYAKGLQFADRPHFKIDKNIFRFEVRTKQSKSIDALCFTNLNNLKSGLCAVDLLSIENYNALFQSLMNEWENVLIINLDLKNKENTPEFWNGILANNYRHKFLKSKQNYYQNLEIKNNLHHLIKCKIIDKITALQKGTFSTQKTTINKGNLLSERTLPNKINLEYVPFQFKDEVNNRLCKVTNLDISMQKKGSLFLCSTGLKWYIENAPETFRKVSAKYLTEKMRCKNIDEQIYYIAHNIRNKKTNPQHKNWNARQRFEQGNYKPDQLQMF